MLNSSKNAMQALTEITGVPDLSFNADGFCELVMTEGLSLYFFNVSDTAIEVSARLDAADGLMTDTFLHAVLQANENMPGTARLALEPETDRLLLGQRIDLVGQSMVAFRDTLNGFIDLAKHWRGEGVNALRAQAAAVAVSAGTDDPETMIRV